MEREDGVSAGAIAGTQAAVSVASMLVFGMWPDGYHAAGERVLDSSDISRISKSEGGAWCGCSTSGS